MPRWLRSHKPAPDTLPSMPGPPQALGKLRSPTPDDKTDRGPTANRSPVPLPRGVAALLSSRRSSASPCLRHPPASGLSDHGGGGSVR